ncbi:hypothetical protein BDP67DRAFT_276800 [Colletotrichum lupini]|nr:hypothetical protein BDP67DRAFT_276800 [Colletotrichum lupini]
MAANVDEVRSPGDVSINETRAVPTTDEQDDHDSINGQSLNNGPQRQISLGKRAPTEPIPERTWKFYLDASWALYSYENILSQQNQCIRSRRGHTKTQFEGRDVLSTSFEISCEGRFPYPAEFRQVAKLDGGHDVETGGAGPSAERLPEGTADLRTKGMIFNTRMFGISRTSFTASIARGLPVYVVLGIFRRGQPNPIERVMFCHQPKGLFRELSREIFRLRGFWKTFLSLRHVKGFRLYKCNAKEGTHERVDLDNNGAADLQLLLHTYKQWRVPEHIALAWGDWMHQELNNDSHDVLNGKYSLEIVLGWSVARIAVVILIPVVLSLVIGLWFNSKDWTDLTTIQTAWSIASYIVTAGGFVAALLGIMSSLADK